MIIVKTIVCILMVVCFIICSIICAYTDVVNSKILNKVLATFGLISVILNSTYYALFAADYIMIYLLNMVILTLFSLLFYFFHIWSAGDSKFLIIIMSFVPVKLYVKNFSELNSVVAIIIIFSIAFVYLVFESIYFGFRYKNLLKINRYAINLLSVLKQYVKCTFFVLCFNLAIGYLFPRFVSYNNHILMMINMLIVLLVTKFNSLNNNYFCVLMFSFLLIICVVFKVSLLSDYKIIAFIIFVMLVSILCEKYNYRLIDTKNISENMVLAQSTIDAFSMSKISDLPHYTTEDLRSKISSQEVGAIKKWEKSKYGKSHIVIVRKMPFALFISIGCAFFVIVFSLLYYY